MRGSTRSVQGREGSRKLRRRREREAKKARHAAGQHQKKGAGTSRGGTSILLRPEIRGGTRGKPPEAQGWRKRREKEEEGEGKRRKRRGMSGWEKEGVTSRQPRLTAEEREMNRLEKKLGMKKRKRLPMSFREDGLDYLLNLTGGDNSPESQADRNYSGSASSGEDGPLERETRVHRAREGGMENSFKTKSSADNGDCGNEGAPVIKRARYGEEVEEEVEGSEGVGEEGDSGDREEEGEGEEEEGESDGYIDESEESGQDGGLEEDEEEEEEEEEGEGGRREKQDDKARYLPPHMRGDHRKSSQKIEKLQRNLQGLVNRLSESNVQSIAMQLERMYTENSRNDMNCCLTEVVTKACVSPALLSERFVTTHVLLVAILHNNVGSEVGAYLVQKLALRLDSLLSQPPNYGHGKECNCVVLLIANLYTFKVVHCILIYDIIRKLLETFSERDVELLLLLLKNTGMEIRKDDATSLKDIILQIQSKAAASSVKESSRTRFMLETITALKTNNSRKIPNYDPSLLEHMRRLMRALLHSKGPADENQLKISLSDLLNADQQGRWWVVGSAWTGRESDTPAASSSSGQSVPAESWVLELARKQRMNTDVRRNVFCILMTSEDCVDAFEKLLRLGLKDRQEREIVHVLVDCCLQERQFNPYYAFLGQKFCEFSRTHQVTFQYSLWDRLKTLSDMTSFARGNLRQLLAHLVMSQAVSLAVLRVVEFTELSKADELQFYRKLFHTLLACCSEDTCKAIFSRLSAQPHLKPFRDCLLLFIKHHLSPSSPLSSTSPSSLPRTSNILQTRLKLVEQIMRTQ